MPLNEDEKSAIVARAVEILRAPDKKAQLEALRTKVMAKNDATDVPLNLDDAVYSVIQALEELYGDE